jgi:hypothetical protein
MSFSTILDMMSTQSQLTKMEFTLVFPESELKKRPIGHFSSKIKSWLTG